MLCTKHGESFGQTDIWSWLNDRCFLSSEWLQKHVMAIKSLLEFILNIIGKNQFVHQFPKVCSALTMTPIADTNAIITRHLWHVVPQLCIRLARLVAHFDKSNANFYINIFFYFLHLEYDFHIWDHSRDQSWRTSVRRRGGVEKSPNFAD